MEIIELKQSDDLPSVVRKCNANFKQVAWSSNQAVKKQSRMDMSGIDAAFMDMQNRLDAMERSIENIELSLPGDIADAVSDAIPDAFPPVGSYLMSDTDPGLHYGSTTWTQAGTITADGNTTIQIWKRTA